MILCKHDKDFSKLKVDVLGVLSDFVEKHMDAGLKKWGGTFYKMGARFVKKSMFCYYDELRFSINTPVGTKHYKVKITETKTSWQNEND